VAGLLFLTFSGGFLRLDCLAVITGRDGGTISNNCVIAGRITINDECSSSVNCQQRKYGYALTRIQNRTYLGVCAATASWGEWASWRKGLCDFSHAPVCLPQVC
jgi:hypothetical protein